MSARWTGFAEVVASPVGVPLPYRWCPPHCGAFGPGEEPDHCLGPNGPCSGRARWCGLSIVPLGSYRDWHR